MSLLIDKQLESILPKLYEQDGKEEQIAYAKDMEESHLKMSLFTFDL